MENGVKNISVMIILLVSYSNSVYPQKLKDPMTRNENISHAVVTSKVTTGKFGYYYYEYTVKNPPNNLGKIESMEVDISCDIQLPRLYILRTINDQSDGSNHIPVYAESDTGFEPRITGDNMVYFSIHRAPGTAKKGIRIISAQPPIQRKYILQPNMNSTGWDYSAWVEDIEPDENGDLPFPSAKDFTVEGTIDAPECTRNTSNILKRR